MILIDSNIPMYLVGSAHPHKIDARRILEELIVGGSRLVTDAEVPQEILHRYAAIGRRDAIQPALSVLEEIVDTVFPVEYRDVKSAKDILLGYTSLSARDAIHISVMQRHEITRILTFDNGFRQYPGIDVIS